MEFMQIISAIFGSLTNVIALIVILALTGLSLWGMFRSDSEKIRHYAKQSPSILATVGIFFSFWGISIGLIGLQLTDIENSIPSLLDGLKTKFIASLMGIGASIIVRVFQSFSVENKVAEVGYEEEALALLRQIKEALLTNVRNSPEALLTALKEVIEELPQEFKKQSTLLESIKSSLAGEGDASVTTQLAKVRVDVRDALKEMDSSNKKRGEALNEVLASNFNNLIQRFEDFARIVAENNSKAFIEALEKAMRDFNNNITEQFGENFKELNRAVGELLKWQDQYKGHVEALTANFEVALSGVSSIQNAFADIQERSQKFTEVSSDLGEILQKLDRQLEDLRHHLSSLDQVADSAKQAFPIIEDNLTKLTTGFKKATEQSLTDINNTVGSVGESLLDTTRKVKEATGKIRDIIEAQKETLDVTSQEFKDVVSGAVKTLAKDTKASIDAYGAALQEVVTEQLSGIDKNIKQNNSIIGATVQAASSELEKSVTDAGTVLKTATASIAGNLQDATGAMKGTMEAQQEILNSTSNQFKKTVDQTLHNLSQETQRSINFYQASLQEAVTKQLTSIDENIKQSNLTINSTIQAVSAGLEKTVTDTGTVLKTTTANIAGHLQDATSAMKGTMEAQQAALTSTSDQFKKTVDQTLRDLSQETQSSINAYQISLQRVISDHLAVMDGSIKQNSEVLAKSVQNAGSEFEKSIKNQSVAINGVINEAGGLFKKTIQDTAKEFEKMAATIAENVSDQEKTLKNISQELKAAIDKTLRELTEQSRLSIKEYERSLHELVVSQFTTVNNSITNASKDFNRLLTENTTKSTNVLEQQTQLLDKALQEELKKAIETMGKHLASLSNQFVQDYRPLTEKLREVVRIAEDLKRGR